MPPAMKLFNRSMLSGLARAIRKKFARLRFDSIRLTSCKLDWHSAPIYQPTNPTSCKWDQLIWRVNRFRIGGTLRTLGTCTPRNSAYHFSSLISSPTWYVFNRFIVSLHSKWASRVAALKNKEWYFWDVWWQGGQKIVNQVTKIFKYSAVERAFRQPYRIIHYSVPCWGVGDLADRKLSIKWQKYSNSLRRRGLSCNQPR